MPSQNLPRPARGCTPRAAPVATHESATRSAARETQTPSSRRSAALKMSANFRWRRPGPTVGIPVLGGRGGAKICGSRLVGHLFQAACGPPSASPILGSRGGARSVAHLFPLPLFGTPSLGVDRQGRGRGCASRFSCEHATALLPSAFACASHHSWLLSQRRAIRLHGGQKGSDG